MPRTVSSKVRVKLSAQQTWQLRHHFELEKHIGAVGDRALSLINEDVANEGAENEQRQRVVRCELVRDSTIMGVKPSDLSSDIVSNFFPHRFDEDHGCEFDVELAMKRLNITIKGHSWCLPESETSCFLCTHIKVEARIPGVGGLVEMQLERHMRTGQAAFAQHAVDFLKSNPLPSVPLPPIATVPEAPVHTARGDAKPAAAELNPPVRGSSSFRGPFISWARLTWAFVSTGGVGRVLRARKHVALESNHVEVYNVAPVRLRARRSLCCGCSDSMLDSEDVVEHV